MAFEYVGQVCSCPGDCRCRRELNPPCGCRQHDWERAAAEGRLTPSGMAERDELDRKLRREGKIR